MPTYRGIGIELRSQFDVKSIPEYIPIAQSYYDKRGILEAAPLFTDTETTTCNVYIPFWAGSQFWINYQVEPPVPEGQYFLFKLFIDGSPIVDWSCGRREEWRGKTMFGLFETRGDDGKKRIEKRVFRFTKRKGNPEDAFDPDMNMEIRVYRACARKRISREARPYQGSSNAYDEQGVELVSAGRAGPDHPKRFYKYALIDPKDAPYAIFRYHYRTRDQLAYLGYLEDETDASTLSVPSIENLSGSSMETFHQRNESYRNGTLRGGELEDVFTTISLGDDEDDEVGAPHEQPSQSYRRSANSSESTREEHEEGNNSSSSRREDYTLSVPRSLRFRTPERGRTLPEPPRKQDRTKAESLSYTAHPVYRVEDWEARTPSPVRSIRDGISTPPLGQKRGLTASSLITAVAGAWKRRGTPSSEHSNDTGSRSGSRARDVS